MGVERMAGSNPNYGMAEPASWIEHDHCDLKNLNCVLLVSTGHRTSASWTTATGTASLFKPKCQTWGPDTFKDMRDEPNPEIMQNGLEQLQEMIARDRNHPCIFSWGLCNEVNGQNPPAYKFARSMYEEARRLNPAVCDPTRRIRYSEILTTMWRN